MLKHSYQITCLIEREGGIQGEKGGRGVVGRELEIIYKLDRVGPVDNRPSIDQLHHFDQYFF